MKKIKRVKIKLKNIIISLFSLIVIGLITYFILNKEINNIYITGNSILSEQDILELIGFKDYWKFYKIDNNKIEKRMKSSLLIKDIDVSKNLFSLKIELSEYKILWYQEYNDSYMLSSGETISLSKKIFGIPTLINQIDEKYKMEFIDKIGKIDDDVFGKISEISYSPSDIDSERFLLYMNDKNSVYINLSRLEYLNKYDDLLPQLEGNKGILYLDSGNHFEIKK